MNTTARWSLACVIASYVSLFGQGSYDDLVAQARKQIVATQFAAAATTAQQAIVLDKTRWEGYLVAGMAENEQKHFDLAVTAFSQALAFAPADKKSGIQAQLEKSILAKGPAVPAIPVKEFEVWHWHASGRVEGRMWVGDGKVQVAEHGPGQDESHNVTLECSSIDQVNSLSSSDISKDARKSDPVLANVWNYDVVLARLHVTGKGVYNYTAAQGKDLNGLVAAIKSACEPIWFQRK